MSTHDPVSYEDLIAFACGDLESEAAARVSRHIAENADAATTVARYRLTHERMKHARFDQASEQAIARAKNAMTSADTADGSPVRSILDWVDSMVARLVYDSRLQPLAVRDVGTDSAVHLTFEGEGIEADLRVIPMKTSSGPSHWEVMGQLSIDWNSVQDIEIVAVVAGTEEIVGRAALDDGLMFSLVLPEGRYDLGVRGSARVVVLPELLLE